MISCTQLEFEHKKWTQVTPFQVPDADTNKMCFYVPKFNL